MDNANTPVPAGLFTDIPAFIQYLQDVKSEGMMNVRECKKLFEIQHTHGMEYNELIEIQLNN